MPAAVAGLEDAVHDLTGARWEAGHPIPDRYSQLRGSLYGSRDSHARSAPSSVIPLWVDALKLLILIDRRAAVLEHCWPPRRRYDHPADHPTIRRYRQILVVAWRPQDVDAITTISRIIAGYTKAVNDLFATKPIDLPNPCPECGRTHTYRIADDGERIRAAALQVSPDGAICRSCHRRWRPDELAFLGRLLGYQLEGVIG